MVKVASSDATGAVARRAAAGIVLPLLPLERVAVLFEEPDRSLTETASLPETVAGGAAAKGLKSLAADLICIFEVISFGLFWNAGIRKTVSDLLCGSVKKVGCSGNHSIDRNSSPFKRCGPPQVVWRLRLLVEVISVLLKDGRDRERRLFWFEWSGERNLTMTPHIESRATNLTSNPRSKKKEH